jgi:sugar lactone lactonase YvrE
MKRSEWLANGIALSSNGKELWVTEFSSNLLYRVALALSHISELAGSRVTRYDPDAFMSTKAAPHYLEPAFSTR